MKKFYVMSGDVHDSPDFLADVIEFYTAPEVDKELAWRDEKISRIQEKFRRYKEQNPGKGLACFIPSSTQRVQRLDVYAEAIGEEITSPAYQPWRSQLAPQQTLRPP